PRRRRITLGVYGGCCGNCPCSTLFVPRRPLSTPCPYTTLFRSGSRVLDAVLANQASGTLAVTYPLTLSQADAMHTNAGTISVSGDRKSPRQTSSNSPISYAAS